MMQGKFRFYHLLLGILLLTFLCPNISKADTITFWKFSIKNKVVYTGNEVSAIGTMKLSMAKLKSTDSLSLFYRTCTSYNKSEFLFICNAKGDTLIRYFNPSHFDDQIKFPLSDVIEANGNNFPIYVKLIYREGYVNRKKMFEGGDLRVLCILKLTN